ncbi:DUF3164 family protein [Pseudomonas qingdaonensis]|nr:DUF3164 family protein [Pseudomonas qingdaonensis]
MRWQNWRAGPLNKQTWTNVDEQHPAGFRQDAKGHLVPEELIKPIDLARDELVNELVGHAKSVSATLAHFKAVAFGDIKAFVELSAEQYKANIGGKKGEHHPSVVRRAIQNHSRGAGFDQVRRTPTGCPCPDR